MSPDSYAEVTKEHGPDAGASSSLSLPQFLLEVLKKIDESGESLRPRRLDQDIHECRDLGNRIIPMGLILGGTSTLEREQVQSYYRGLRGIIDPNIEESLDLVSETLLMVDDRDLQASGTIAASFLIQRTLPDGTVARDLVLQSLLDLLGSQYNERMSRHPEIFSPLKRIKNVISVNDLPRFLGEISDALEDIACDKDVFLDNPVELIEKTEALPEESEETFRKARVQSGADLPTLSDEMAQIDTLCTLLNWTREQGIQFATKLYQAGIMDSRTKVGLAMNAILTVVEDLNRNLDSPVRSIEVNDEHGTEAYTFNADTQTIILNLKYRGALTSTVIRTEHEEMLEKAKEAEIVVVTNLLEEAVKKYDEARNKARLSLVPEEEERAAILDLKEALGLSEIQAFELVIGLYGAEKVSFSSDPNHGISVGCILRLVQTCSQVSPVREVQVDPAHKSNLPFRLDKEAGVVFLHSSFNRLTDASIELCLSERSVDPLGIEEPSEEAKSKYKTPEEAGSLSQPENLEAFIEEFGLAAEFAQDSFEVLFEDFPQFRDTITVQTLRTLVSTLNKRLAPDAKINVVTGWSRSIPNTSRPDHDSIAWLTAHEEEDSRMIMLTFNFHYGEDKPDHPPMSNELLLDWCQHFKADQIGEME